MDVNGTTLKGVLLIKLKVFKDHRGEYVDLYNEDNYQENGIKVRFVEDDFSVSIKDVLRGIHSDNEASKLISCLYGEICLVVVNCDTDSDDFGMWQSFTLSESNRQQVFVPPKHGVAHLVLSDRAIFHYKQSRYYDPSRQVTYRWDDSRFNIQWPIKSPVLSQRDELGHYV